MQSFILSAVISQYFPHSLNDIFDILMRQFRREREGKGPMGDEFGMREFTHSITKGFLIIGVEVKGHIMDSSPDVLFVQRLEKFIPGTPNTI